jgi:predicted phage terminase large subunit-like protein
VHAAAPDAEAGNCHLPKNASWVDAFIEEAAQFPNGANDDQVDAWSQAMARFRLMHSGIFEYYCSSDDSLLAAGA